MYVGTRKNEVIPILGSRLGQSLKRVEDEELTASQHACLRQIDRATSQIGPTLHHASGRCAKNRSDYGPLLRESWRQKEPLVDFEACVETKSSKANAGITARLAIAYETSNPVLWSDSASFRDLEANQGETVCPNLPDNHPKILAPFA